MKTLYRYGLRVVVSFGLIAVLLIVTDGANAVSRLVGSDWRWLAACFGFLTIQTVLMAIRWKITAAPLGLSIRLPWAIREYYLAQLINQTVPGGVVGDAARAVRARHRADLASAAMSVMIERLAGQTAIFTIGLIGFLMALVWPGGISWPGWVWQIVLFSTAGLIVTGGLLWKLRNMRPLRPVRALTTAMEKALETRRMRYGQAVLSLTIASLNLAAFYACAQATGTTLSVEAIFTLIPLILSAMLIPASVGGWGWREGAAAALFPLAGATGSAGIAAGMAYGIVMLAASLPGLIWMLTAIQGGHGPRTALGQVFKRRMNLQTQPTTKWR
ncbi:lysylphosphatidylglycerol synthase transmembrane domain-containing protein [Actibacterium sp. 188UL27-1]|uniref:lysylphosphatidylglycerol synthase transmembrane domain-containing protein n=1 Tax=Actibacterium sp. 188UL27-1 TaxID=2786961 RepID=UPI00195C3C04|nr:lysylphosphatidylglycerol synthase transmembrane domain-containing protein [Actibacterium sp. 188UL27-1]MBM7069266.1 flippase-like domain-containing protein [Actibacterium sp. 188UL27-1]